MKTPPITRNKLRITLPQIMIIMGIAVSIWFLSEFSDMMKTSQTIRAQESQLLATVTALHDQQISLKLTQAYICLLYTSPSPRDTERSRMPSSA